MEKEEIERVLEEVFLKYEQDKPERKFIIWVSEEALKDWDNLMKEEIERYLIKDLCK